VTVCALCRLVSGIFIQQSDNPGYIVSVCHFNEFHSHLPFYTDRLWQDLVANSEAPLSDYLNWMLLFMCSDSGSVNVHHLTVNMQVIIRCVQMSNSTPCKNEQSVYYD
jgi:hypothetical protein